MKAKIVLVLGLLVLGFLPVLLLMQFSRSDYYVQDVVKRRLCCTLARETFQRLPLGSWYLAGADSTHIYLGNRGMPSQILIVDPWNTAGLVHRVIVSDDYKFEEPTQIWIDSPYVYVAGLRSGTLLVGDLTNFVVTRIAGEDSFLVGAVPMDENSFAIRTLSKRRQELVLGKRMSYPPFVREVPGLLETQIDGVFCTDGMLRYSGTGYLIYVYYYRNEFICMDTSINLRYRARTIDTISRAHISVAHFESSHRSTQTRPPVVVNVRCFVSASRLFVQSRMMAGNDRAEDFETSSVIDVYSTADGDYQFSFYVPHFGEQVLKDFMVDGDEMIVLYGDQLVTYNLPGIGSV